MSEQAMPETTPPTEALRIMTDACRTIRYLRSKCAGIAHLGYDAKDTSREALSISAGWDFLDYMEPEAAAMLLLACHSEPGDAVQTIVTALAGCR